MKTTRINNSAVNAGPSKGTIKLQAIYKNGKWEYLGSHRLDEACRNYWKTEWDPSGLHWSSCKVINIPGLSLLWTKDEGARGLRKYEAYSCPYVNIPVEVEIEFLCLPIIQEMDESGNILDMIKGTYLTKDFKYVSETYEIPKDPEDLESFRKLYKIVEIEGNYGSVGTNPGNREVSSKYRDVYGFIGTWKQCQNLVGSMFRGGIVEDKPNTSPRLSGHYGIWVEGV